jgi:hypothetical protein
MPVRTAVNTVYAMLTDGLDAEQRDEFDAKLHGWDELDRRANQVLWDELDESGGEG